jgi:hypothetical protein
MVTGCGKADYETVTEKTVPDTARPIEPPLEEEINDQFSLITSRAADWTQTLTETQECTFDLDMDGQSDVIYLTYEKKEGSQYLSRFEVKIADVSEPFLIENYDASFEKLEVFDFDQDGTEELIILFDTHGSGGQGTHDIFVLSVKNHFLKIYLMEPNTDRLAGLEDSWEIDEPYMIQRVLYHGNEELLIRQYIWGEQGHSDHVGDLISIVALEKESGRILSKEAWMEREDEVADR